jgi:CRP-like cAMP-binding protein
VVQEMGSMAAELATLEAGVVVGEVALLRDGVRTASIVAMAPTLVFRLAFEDVGYVLQNNPPLHAHLEDLAKRRTA